ncbi:MAG: hypothetical protein GY817_07325 [bacterium]|nr:hypothetical protein [bacterium]
MQNQEYKKFKERRNSVRRFDFLIRKTDLFESEKRLQERRESVLFGQKLLSRIAVKPPYYALKNLEKVDGSLKASIPIEQSLGNETSPLTAGETSRHLAILGSCALAEKNTNDFSYYLAVKAVYRRHIKEIKADYLIGVSEAKMLNKRKGKAFNKLLNEKNEVITTLDVDYTIISQNLFERQFKKHKRDMRHSYISESFFNRQNFYKCLFEIPNAKIQDDILTLDIGEVKPEMCMGHFPFYPAMPVAFLSQILFNVSINYLKTVLKKKNIKVVLHEGNINAFALVFSGKHIKVKVQLLDQVKNIFIFFSQLIEQETSKLLIELNNLKVEIVV